jgi:hypothetical protein
MNPSTLVFTLMTVLALAQGPSIAYFTDVRDLHVTHPDVQNFVVVDETIWQHSRPDLSDLRIYDGDTQVQYALSEQRAGSPGREEAAKILNLGSTGGHTEFDLDMGRVTEYDRIRLRLDAKDFVITASLRGGNEAGSKNGTELPTATLYDFTREQLGFNQILKMPTSSFRYLHVKLSSGISPAQVKGAWVYNQQETKASWTTVGSCGSPVQEGRATIIPCISPPRVPLDRIRFRVDPKQVNFRRAVALSDANDHDYEIGGEITRVRINRAGATAISEEMEVPVADRHSGRLKVRVDNGDNQPLALSGVELLSLERRLYFDPQGKSELKLYYGDEKLASPVYDYGRFFKADPEAARAELGPGSHNGAYAGRADDRPWSERHTAVLWLAMILAVAVLAGLAIRGLKTKAASS